MTDIMPLPFDLPAVRARKLTVGFDGGQLSSDGGLLLLREAERRLGIADRLAGVLRDRRDPTRVLHGLSQMLKTRVFAICCGYEDGNDLGHLRHDPLLKLAVGRCPQTGAPLCSQSTMSRLENAPTKIEAARLTGALVDQFCASFPQPPAAITLDIDDTVDEVHGGQQLSFFNAHYDTRCFLPIHVYHVESGKPVVVILREGKTPGGVEIRTILKHLVRRIRSHWPATKITIRGDGHYGRAEAMEWCEANDVGTIFGFAGNSKLKAVVTELSDHLRFRHAAGADDKLRTLPKAASPGAQLASDRTSCPSPTANQVRLVLHTAAFWVMHEVRAAIPKTSDLARCEFGTLRLKLIKIAARIVEHKSRIRVHLPTCCPQAAVFAAIAATLTGGLMPAVP